MGEFHADVGEAGGNVGHGVDASLLVGGEGSAEGGDEVGEGRALDGDGHGLGCGECAVGDAKGAVGGQALEGDVEVRRGVFDGAVGVDGDVERRAQRGGEGDGLAGLILDDRTDETIDEGHGQAGDAQLGLQSRGVDGDDACAVGPVGGGQVEFDLAFAGSAAACIGGEGCLEGLGGIDVGGGEDVGEADGGRACGATYAGFVDEGEVDLVDGEFGFEAFGELDGLGLRFTSGSSAACRPGGLGHEQFLDVELAVGVADEFDGGVADVQLADVEAAGDQADQARAGGDGGLDDFLALVVGPGQALDALRTAPGEAGVGDGDFAFDELAGLACDNARREGSGEGRGEQDDPAHQHEDASGKAQQQLLARLLGEVG